MIIQSIQIENFRQFKGQQPLINFSTDSDRNVTVLLGDNTSGKTTFLQAFNWCLYGFANFKSSKDLLNKEVEQEVLDNKQYKAIMSVTLTLMHHEYEYTVQRSQAYVKRGEEVKPLGEESVDISRKGADGTTEQLQYPKKRTVINSIFPQELSTYFLYDTERFKNITENADLKTAVEDLLGLTAYENAIEHIGPINSTSTQKVLGMLRNSLESEDEKNSHQLQAQIEKIDQNIENIKKEQIQLEEDITYYAEKAKEKRGELMKFANAKEKELERQEAEKTLDIYRYSLKKKRERKFEMIYLLVHKITLLNLLFIKL
ncbi:AAA family ATPase [Savagea faecisuis]|uniref:Nuclease SbcCD subunit C n=1 Tax=Savagea faecisuis TaxID=1274803 RepID=A0ABW3GWV7_9BACL